MLINALGHSRCAVAYNAEDLLMADNWGDNWISREPINATHTDEYAAGFSKVSKWCIFSWLRDAVVLRPPKP